jgi:peptide chain release factor
MDNIIQISSGRGPAECCWVVARVVKEIIKYTEKNGGNAETINREKGPEAHTLNSSTLRIIGLDKALLQEWIGTILWVGQSPYRKFHKRKNWYIGVYFVDNKTEQYSSDNIYYQTMRASGPGGQHVNRTESAVRAIHKESGISVVASDSRSQFRNKQLATQRLLSKLKELEDNTLSQMQSDKWDNHNNLVRGNPVKTFRGIKFKED